jgi:hypothetical protein
MVSESQKQALKKWKAANKDRTREYNKKWRADNEEYRVKQIGYVIKSQNRKRAFTIECKRLRDIEY